MTGPDPRVEAVLRLLHSYEPPDTLRRDHRDRTLELLAAVADPLARSQYHPGHITASAFVLDSAGTSLLLVHHRRLGRWLQPGGHVDDHDGSLEEAARREVTEETGVDLRQDPGCSVFDVDVHPIPPGRGEPGHLHHDVRFLLRAPPAVPVPNGEVLSARWVPLEDVPALTRDGSVRRIADSLQEGRP